MTCREPGKWSIRVVDFDCPALYIDKVEAEANARHLRAMGSMATKLVAAANKAKEEKSLEDAVLAHYLADYRAVFEKRDFNPLPAHKK
jgi:predicted GNAT family N-acyltransferase